MAMFQWKGNNHNGVAVSGRINADNLLDAKKILKRQKIKLSSIKRKTQWLKPSTKAIKTQHITAVLTQLSAMLSAGIPLVQSIQMVANGQNAKGLKDLLGRIANLVSAGIPLSNALGQHPKYFDPLLCDLVNMGEQTGRLDHAINLMTQDREKRDSLINKIQKAMYYPIAVVVFAIGITAILLIYVIPQFEQLFSSFGADLPILTQWVLSLSTFLQGYGFSLIALISFLSAVIWKVTKNSVKLRTKIDKTILTLPLFGNMLNKAIITRYCQTLSMTLQSGITLNQCLTYAGQATNNKHYQSTTPFIRNEVEAGVTLSSALNSVNIFPTILIQMTAVGEASGALEKMLSKLSELYSRELDDQINGLTSLLEPVIMLVLGAIIGTLILAMYLPIFQIANVV